MKLRWTSVAWSIAYLLLLLSLLTSLSIITIFFLIVPVVVLYSTLNLRQFIMHLVPIWLVTMIVAIQLEGRLGIYVAVLGIFFMVPGIVMGRLYKKNASALRVIFTTGITTLVEMLLLLIFATVVYKFNLAVYVKDIVEFSVAPMRAMADINPDIADIFSPEFVRGLWNYTLQMIPFALIISSFTMVVITHAICRPILESMNYSVSKLRPAREWRLPRSLIWYYLLAVLLEYFVASNITGVLAAFVLNFMPLVHIAFTIQTIGFVFFMAHHRKWNSFLPFLLSLVVVLIPPLRIVGIIDLAFPLREYITRPKR